MKLYWYELTSLVSSAVLLKLLALVPSWSKEYCGFEELLVLNSSAVVLLGICHLPELVYSLMANHPESLEKDFSLRDVRGEPGWLKPTRVSLQCSIIILD